MGQWPHFFPLTSTFFGLTSTYKIPLLEEIFICTQYLKGVTYNDVLSMPVYERKYFIGLLTKDVTAREEQAIKLKEQSETKSGKGSRNTRVGGDALKNKMNNGEIPLI